MLVCEKKLVQESWNGTSASSVGGRGSHDLLQVLPNLALGGGVPQQVGRVIGGEQARAAKIEPLAAKARNGLMGAEQRLRGHVAQADDYPGRDDSELAEQKG